MIGAIFGHGQKRGLYFISRHNVLNLATFFVHAQKERDIIILNIVFTIFYYHVFKIKFECWIFYCFLFHRKDSKVKFIKSFLIYLKKTSVQYFIFTARSQTKHELTVFSS